MSIEKVSKKRELSDGEQKDSKKLKKLEKYLAQGYSAEEAKKLRKQEKEKKEKKDKKEKDVKEKKDKKEKKSKTEDSDSEKAEKSSSTTPAPVDANDVAEFMKTNAITVEDSQKSGLQPFLSFNQLHVQQSILNVLTKFPKPTPIQAVSWPFLLNGRDVVGVAETGSGKTMAFSVPAVNHLLSSKSKGVRVLVVSPTRELAMQIYDNLKMLTSVTDVNAVCVYGGVPKEGQRRDIKKSSIVIATPGRLNDLIDEGSCDLSKVEYLVLDEADRMLEKGFEEDIKKIIGNTNAKGRQTLMFTATWPPQVRDLASSFMNDAVKVSIGDRDELSANKRITQTVEVVDPRSKEYRLFQLLKEHQSGKKRDDKILIFALYKKEAARVERVLQGRGYRVSAIHGDLNQQQRTKALEEFKSGESKIMLATDVAARGLDIPAVKVVINLTFPLTVEDYVHRIGRTGRAGQTGLAITLFTEHEKHLSGALINVLRGANQPVPEDLLKFGSHTKKKEHGVYGAFYKEIDPTKKAKKITFD
ncbi:ATP-dependent RNA helicase Dbp3p [Trichomonascus vanleenenianus]|uniref:RNA-dependent ATPase DBP3 n=1 Tax=Trichomonascus vanleenenianus TaxID=2268995 RepID=UPI003ECBA22D